MIIRHAQESKDDLPLENTFVACDDLETPLGEATVHESFCDLLCPARPHLLLVRAQCEVVARDALIGAATARALQLARETPDVAARVYTECAPEDEDRMRALEALGYQDDDGLIRMRKMIMRGPIVKPLPAACTIVRDYLIDDNEGRFFLERYNAMFARHRDMNWLRAVKAMPHFARLLVVAEGGLVGELLTWSDGDCGVVGVVLTTPAWQMRGVGAYLMELARLYWLECGLREAYVDVWSRLTGMVRLAAASGFRPDAMLARYPGIDIDPNLSK